MLLVGYNKEPLIIFKYMTILLKRGVLVALMQQAGTHHFMPKPIDHICFSKSKWYERSSLPSKNFPCISMDMLQIGALVLLGRLVEAYLLNLISDVVGF